MDAELNRKLRVLAEMVAGSPHNLVSRGDRADVYGIHVVECLAYLDALPLASGQSWIDVGTGGGFPGLVLAAARSDVRWTLVDSTGKKTDAVREFAAGLALDNVVVINGRAEELGHDPQFRQGFDGAISRAVAPLPTLLELLAGFVRPSGSVVAAKGPRWEEELADARPALSQLGLVEAEVVPIATAPRPTWLVMMRRRGDLSKRFPRRAGVPRAQPIGGTHA